MMIDKSVSDSRITAKNDVSNVSCWNCLNVEHDIDTEVPLSQIRKQQRRNFKLYSFVVSEISQPKVIPTKQKVKENYVIGKKIENEIRNNDNEHLNGSLRNNKKLELNSKSDIDDHVTAVLESPDKNEQNLSCDHVNVVTPLNKKLIVEKITNDANDSKKGLKEVNIGKELLTSSKLEIDDHNVPVVEISTKYVERNVSNKALSIVTPFSNNLNNKIAKKVVSNTNDYKNGAVDINNKVNVCNSNKKEHTSISNIKNLTHLKNISKTNPANLATKYKDSEKDIISITEKETSLISAKPETVKHKMSDFLNKEEEQNLSRETEESNLPPLNSKGKNVSEINIDPHVKFLDNSLEIFKSLNIKSLPIPHEVQIKSSTPKAHGEHEDMTLDMQSNCTPLVPIEEITRIEITSESPGDMDVDKMEKGEDIEDIIIGIKNLSFTDIDTNVAKDKNTTNSASSYQTSTLKDLKDIEVVKQDILNESSHNKSNIPVPVKKNSRQDFSTSLPILNNIKKNILKTTTSKTLISDSDKTKARPAKSLRWSTLDLKHRSNRVADDVYCSEVASSNRATLPRRSNSPLPHDKDLQIDSPRFSLNKSGGLQTRSESMASVYSGAGEGTRSSVTVHGEVQVSLLYNYRLGALEVGVKRCRELAPVDVKRNRSDPYVKVYLLPDKSKAGKRKTKVKKNTLNPVFEETLSFVQPLASLSARTLWLSVWHADMFGRNDFLGEVTLPLADVVFDDPAPMWYSLHERTEQFDEQQGSRGDLIVALKLDITESARGKGTLHVLVKEAKNLVATKPNGLADVFCKSYLLPERGRLAKQKTGVCSRTLNPKWEHTFTYRGISVQELSTRALELSLWDRDRLASNDFMGAIRLSLGTGTYMGASVNWMDSVGKEVSLWQRMLQQPNFWVENSIPLRPHLTN